MWIVVNAASNNEIAINTENVIYMKKVHTGTQIYFGFNGPGPKGDDVVRSVTVRDSMTAILVQIDSAITPAKKKPGVRLLGF